MAFQYIRQALGAFAGTAVVRSHTSNKETMRHISAAAVSNCGNIADNISNVLLDLDEDLRYPAHYVATGRSPALLGSTVASFVGLALHRYLTHLNPLHMLFLSRSPPYPRQFSPKSSHRRFSAPLLVLDSPTEPSVAATDPQEVVSPFIHPQGHLADLRLLGDPFLHGPALRTSSHPSSAQVSPQLSSDTAFSDPISPQFSVSVAAPQPKGRDELSSSQWVCVEGTDVPPFSDPVSSTSIVPLVPEWFSGSGGDPAGGESILFEHRPLDHLESSPCWNNKPSKRTHTATIATDTGVDGIPLGEHDLLAELGDNDSAQSGDNAPVHNSGISYLSIERETSSRGQADGEHTVARRLYSVVSRDNVGQYPTLLNDLRNTVQGSSAAPRVPQIVINISCCRDAVHRAAHEDEQPMPPGEHVEIRFQDTIDELQSIHIACTRTGWPGGSHVCAYHGRCTPAPVDPVSTVDHLRHEGAAERSQPVKSVALLPERLPRALSGHVNPSLLQQPFYPTQAQSPSFLGLPPSIGPPPGLPPPPHKLAQQGLRVGVVLTTSSNVSFMTHFPADGLLYNLKTYLGSMTTLLVHL
ncbi:hypothetical protein C8Q79DRAFT_578712 [Trametes meyenii]|nr:hypothetical protein C8Q79DRAFT_578712 [Trametes meyenii]